MRQFSLLTPLGVHPSSLSRAPLRPLSGCAPSSDLCSGPVGPLSTTVSVTGGAGGLEVRKGMGPVLQRWPPRPTVQKPEQGKPGEMPARHPSSPAWAVNLLGGRISRKGEDSPAQVPEPLSHRESIRR